jgi:hypothetical protein
MKKLLCIVGSVFLLSFAGEKFFTVKFSEAQLNKHWQKLNTVKAIVEESNLPHQQVKFITQSIDSLQMDIAVQVQQQLKDTVKNNNKK